MLHFHVSGIPETWQSVSKVGQRLLEETIRKMQTEGKPIGASILTEVDRPISFGLR